MNNNVISKYSSNINFRGQVQIGHTEKDRKEIASTLIQLPMGMTYRLQNGLLELRNELIRRTNDKDKYTINFKPSKNSPHDTFEVSIDDDNTKDCIISSKIKTTDKDGKCLDNYELFLTTYDFYKNLTNNAFDKIINRTSHPSDII